jgi:PAS domain S-box-containing protein
MAVAVLYQDSSASKDTRAEHAVSHAGNERGWVGYVIALAAVAVAAWGRWILEPPLQPGSLPFITFFAAVLVAAWFGGWGPALVALALSTLIAAVMFILPTGTLAIGDAADIVGMALFVGLNLVMTALVGRLRSANRQVLRAIIETRELRDWLTVTLSSIGDAVIATDLAGRVTFMNPVAEALTGWSATEAQGRPLADVFAILNEQTREPVSDPVGKVLHSGTVVGLANHTILVRRDGSEIPIEDSAAPIKASGGGLSVSGQLEREGSAVGAQAIAECLGVVLVFRDATERRRAQLAREAHEKQVTSILQSISDAFFAVDQSWRFTYVNSHAETYLGRRAAELLGKRIWEEAPWIAGTQFEQHLRQAVAQRAAVHFHVESQRAGKWFEVHAYPAPEGQGASVYFRDITESKTAQEVIREGAARKTAILNSALDCIVTMDHRGMIEDFNPAAERTFGYSRAEVIGRPLAEMLVPLHLREAHWSGLHRLLKTGEGPVIGRRIEMPAMCKDGREIPVELSITMIRLEHGPDAGKPFFTAYLRDIRDRIDAERAVRESEDRLRATFDQAAAGIAQIGSDGRIQRANRRLCEILGYSEEQLREKTVFELTHPDDRPQEMDLWRAVWSGKITSYSLQKRYVRKDGSIVWVNLSRSCVRDKAGQGLYAIAVIEDITDRKLAEAELRAKNAELQEAIEQLHAIEEELRQQNDELYQTRLAVESQRRRYKDLFEFAPDAYLVTDLTSTILEANKAAAELLGEAGGQALTLIGQPLSDWVHPDQREVFRQRLGELPQAEGAMSWELRIAAESPHRRGEMGSPFANTREWGPRSRNGEAASRNARSSQHAAYFDAALRTAVVRDESGHAVSLRWLLRDVTERKRHEGELHKQTRMLSTLNRLGAAIVGELELDKLVGTITDAATELSGAKFGAFFYNVIDDRGESYMLYTLSGAPREAFAKFPMPRNTELFEATFRGQGVIRLDDVTRDPRYGKNAPRKSLPEGHLPVRSYLAVPVISRSGRVLGGLFFGHPEVGVFSQEAQDVVTAIAAQAAVAIDNAQLYRELQESERRYRTLVEQVTEYAIFMVDTKGIATSWNEGVRRVLGFDEREFVGQSTDRIFTAEDVASGVPRRELEEAAAHGRALGDRWMVRKDGTQFWASGITSALHDEQGKLIGYTKVMRDLTRQRQVEEEIARHRDHLEDLVTARTRDLEASHLQLRNAERLASLGTLAAGIGHDMGNLLLPIRSRLDAMRADGLPSKFQEHVKAIEQSANYLQALTKGLRLLSLDPDDDSASGTTTDFVSWWKDIESLLRNVLPRQATLELATSDANGKVNPLRIAPHRMTQIMFNLVKNAGDAIRGRQDGRVVVSVEPGPEHAARLIVADNGVGMSDEIRQRAMEPFFTTKPRGISTGLGLSLVRGIIQSVNGDIDIESAPGQGTRVVLTIPVAKQPPKGQGAGPVAALSLADVRTRMFIATVLEVMGAKAVLVEAAQPPEADIWITNVPLAKPEIIGQFLSKSPKRIVISFGSEGQPETKDHIIQLADRTPPSRIREVIQQVVSRLNADEQ